jgi:hypothetical protein
MSSLFIFLTIWSEATTNDIHFLQNIVIQTRDAVERGPSKNACDPAKARTSFFIHKKAPAARINSFFLFCGGDGELGGRENLDPWMREDGEGVEARHCGIVDMEDM